MAILGPQKREHSGGLIAAALAPATIATAGCRGTSGGDRGARNRGIASCAALCRREAVPGSDEPRSGGKMVFRPVPWLEL
jgi:hypothetical protein